MTRVRSSRRTSTARKATIACKATIAEGGVCRSSAPLFFCSRFASRRAGKRSCIVFTSASRSFRHTAGARGGANPRARALGMDDVRRDAHHDDTSPARSEVRRRLCTLRDAVHPISVRDPKRDGAQESGWVLPTPTRRYTAPRSRHGARCGQQSAKGRAMPRAPKPKRTSRSFDPSGFFGSSSSTFARFRTLPLTRESVEPAGAREGILANVDWTIPFYASSLVSV